MWRPPRTVEERERVGHLNLRAQTPSEGHAELPGRSAELSVCGAGLQKALESPSQGIDDQDGEAIFAGLVQWSGPSCDAARLPFIKTSRLPRWAC